MSFRMVFCCRTGIRVPRWRRPEPISHKVGPMPAPIRPVSAIRRIHSRFTEVSSTARRPTRLPSARRPYGVANQVPTMGAPPMPSLQSGGFESPVYASVDAPLAAGAVDRISRTISTIGANAANSWAILLGMTPDRPEFSLVFNGNTRRLSRMVSRETTLPYSMEMEAPPLSRSLQTLPLQTIFPGQRHSPIRWVLASPCR